MPSQVIALVFAAHLACSLQAQSGRSEIQKQGIDYSETFGDANATLSYSPEGNALFFKAASPGNQPIALAKQCHMLDVLLARVLKDHPAPEFTVLLGVTQDALMEPLDELLLKDPKWDSKRGLAREGKTPRYLVGVLNRSGILNPIAKVFEAHGYTFCIRAMNRVVVERISKHKGARLPVYVAEMDFAAKKK